MNKLMNKFNKDVLFMIREVCEKYAIYPSNTHDFVVLEQVMLFTMEWACFENKCTDTDFNIDNFKKFIKGYTIPESMHETINSCLKYFQDRYSDSDLYSKLRFKGKDKFSPYYLDILNKDADYSEKLKACMAIIYRYRNNLFHGTKFHDNFELQEENLKHANKLLHAINMSLPANGKLEDAIKV